MGFKAGKNRSGIDAADRYRENKGLGAASVLLAGRSFLCKSADHSSGSELCAEVIVRLAGDNTKLNRAGDFSVVDSVNKAVNNLREGLGFHVAQADHAGGNTCADVISKAAN